MMGYDPKSLRDLVDFMAKALVDNPDKVEVSELVGEQTQWLNFPFPRRILVR